jgi:hypothetical protein
MTASADLRYDVYVEGLSMSPLAHVTEVDQGGGVDEEVTADHEGSPERL